MNDRIVFEINPDYQDLMAALNFSTLDEVFAYEGNDYAAKSRTTSTLRIRVPVQDREVVLYLKRYWYDTPVWKYSFRASRAKIEQGNLRWMRANGLPVPETIAWGEQRSRFTLKNCFLITLGVPHTQNLDEFLPRYAGQDRGPKQIVQKRNAIRLLAQYVKTMHAKGYIDHDLFFRNVLISQDDSGEYDFSFIDSPKGSLCQGAKVHRGRMYDLASLNKSARTFLSLTDCLRFYKAYLGEQRLETPDWVNIDKIESASEKMRRKSQRKRMQEASR